MVERLRAAGCVFAEEEADLLVTEARDAEELDRLVTERVAGTPLEHVLGWAEFCGSRILLDPGVFVPRQRTALLVEVAVAGLRPGAVVLDLCCGSGAVGAAMAARLPGLVVHAADADPAAVACARRNLDPERVHLGDLYLALPDLLRGSLDAVVANAPYVPSDAVELMPREARLYEPRAALEGGADGVDLHRRIAREAAAWLRPGGQLLVETGERQAARTRRAFVDGGLTATVIRDDDLDATVVVGSPLG